MKFLIAILSLSLVLAGCDAFSTRNPEEPNTSVGSYIPPTSYDVVIFNLKNAMTEKNLDNYMNCFSDSVVSKLPNYRFYPDGQTLAQNPNLFELWSVRDEEKFFTFLSSNITDGTTPNLNFVNEDFQVFQDSIIYNSDYFFNFELTNDVNNDTYTGSMRLVLKNNSNGFWYITSWYDFINTEQETNLTWSFLKSKYIF